MKITDKSDCLAVKECIVKGIIKIETLSEKELDALIDFETENIIKSETEPDTSFLDACYEAMRKFRDYREVVQEQKCKEISDNVYLEYLESSMGGKTKKKRAHFAKRATAACAAMLAVCFMSFSVMAASLGGYSAAWEYVSRNVSAIMGMTGSQNVGNITIIKGEYTKKYATIEELLIAENLNILYPSALPEGVEIKNIIVTYFDDDKYVISYGFNSNDVSITIQNYYSFNENDISNTPDIETIQYGEYEFYILNLDNITYQAMAQIQKCEYYISCIDYEELLFILSNLKGITL